MNGEDTAVGAMITNGSLRRHTRISWEHILLQSHHDTSRWLLRKNPSGLVSSSPSIVSSAMKPSTTRIWPSSIKWKVSLSTEISDCSTWSASWLLSIRRSAWIRSGSSLPTTPTQNHPWKSLVNHSLCRLSSHPQAQGGTRKQRHLPTWNVEAYGLPWRCISNCLGVRPIAPNHDPIRHQQYKGAAGPGCKSQKSEG